MRERKNIDEAIQEADKRLDDHLQARMPIEDYHNVAEMINEIIALNIIAVELAFKQKYGFEISPAVNEVIEKVTE